MKIYQLFKNYTPKNEQEQRDQKLILDFIERNPDCLNRENLTAHITASAFVVNHDFDKIVFAFHHIYQSWAWVGGHADGDDDLLHVALKEAKEETGLSSITPYNNDIFTIDVIYVHNHIKKGVYVPDHLHLNATYLLLADEKEIPKHNPDEHQDVRWFDIDEVMNDVSENRMKSVYKKAFDFINLIKEKR
jgi:8-oxo-dGTP pyrophosphatase MutT (NUDIX family)